MKFISGSSADEIGKYLAKWWQENTGCMLSDSYSAIGVLRGNTLLGVATFSEYTGNNIEIHLYTKYFGKEFMKYILNYVFNELKCSILRAKPHRCQKKVISFLENFGFNYECFLEKYYGNTVQEDALVYKFKKEQATKWITLNECT